MDYLKQPISALQEYAQRRKESVPVFEDGRKLDNDTKKIIFWFSVTYNGRKYGPEWGESKMAAKTKVASLACDALGIRYDGRIYRDVVTKAVSKEPLNQIIVELHNFVKKHNLPKPECKLLKEEGEPHSKTFTMRYVMGERRFTIAAGRSKEHAKRRAAAMALSELLSVRLRVFIRGPISEVSFGNTIAEHAWETYGILCEELTDDIHFCMRSELCAFLLEDKESGAIRTVSLGTGTTVSNPMYRKANGEAIIDSHGLIIARRSLLVYLYDQLEKLLSKKGNSIFEMTGSHAKTSVRLKSKYDLHLYMKNPPCGDGRLFCQVPHPTTRSIEVKDDHFRFHNTGEVGGLKCKGEDRDVVSCSDKLLLWNYVGVQGALLSNFITPISISSVTITNHYSPDDLVRTLCCRFSHNLKAGKGPQDINHPWLQYGSVDGIEDSMDHDWRKSWSVYWSHEGLELTDELLLLAENGGIIDGYTGCHLVGSEREGRIPIICKRNFFRSYRKICVLAGAAEQFVHSKSYGNHKCVSMSYRGRKNNFFKHLDLSNLGLFPIMKNVDEFYLPKDDQTEKVG